MPVARPEDDGNHARLTFSVPLQCALHFLFVTIVGCDEIRTYQQEHDIRRIEMAVYGFAEFGSSCYLAVMPGRDKALR